MPSPVETIAPAASSSPLIAESLDSFDEVLPNNVADPVPGWRIHFWFGVITLIYAIDSADRFLVGAVLPNLKKDFAPSDALAGLLGGIAYLGLALLSLPSGALVDRWSRKGMIAFWSAALTGWFSDRLGLGPALAISLILGIGAAIALIAASSRSYLADDRKREALGAFEVELGDGI